MRSNGTHRERASDPGWVHSLVELLGISTSNRLDRLTPLPLEVAITDCIEVFEQATPHSRTSRLIVGDLRKSIADPRSILRTKDGNLPPDLARFLQDPAWMRNEQLRTAAVTDMRALQRSSLSPSALLGLWNDTVKRFHNSRVTWEGRLWMIDRMRCAWELSGRSWRDTSSHLRALLSNDVHAIWLESGAPDPVPTLGGTASKSLDERLELCRIHVGGTGKRGDCIVYLALSSAELSDDRPLSVGERLTFYDSTTLSDLIDNSPEDDRLPSELRGESTVMFLDLKPEEVVARVSLPDYLIDRAVSAATRQVVSHVRLACLYSAWAWRLKEGYALYVNGKSVSTRFAHGLVDEPPPAIHGTAARVAVAEQLGLQTSKLSDAMASQDPIILALMDMLRTLESVVRSSADMQVVSTSRILERVARLFACEEWSDLLRLQATVWAVGEARQRLIDDLDRCLDSSMSAYRGDVYDVARLDEISVACHDRSGQPDFVRALSLIPDLEQVFKFGTSRRLIAADIEHATVNGARMLQRIGHLNSTYLMLVDRLERTRHGLMHGWPVQDYVLDSVSGFGVMMARWSVHFAVTGIVERDDPLATLNEEVHKAENTQSLLASATHRDSLAQALLGEA